jgi:hypothetical protein
VTFADYGRCLHTKCCYLSCANTLQTRYVLNVSVFVDAYTTLSNVAVDTKQCIKSFSDKFTIFPCYACQNIMKSYEIDLILLIIISNFYPYTQHVVLLSTSLIMY